MSQFAHISSMLLKQDATPESKDYFAEIFDNPIRIFLIINNLLGVITTLALEDAKSLDVLEIAKNALNNAIRRVSSEKPILQ